MIEGIISEPRLLRQCLRQVLLGDPSFFDQRLSQPLPFTLIFLQDLIDDLMQELLFLAERDAALVDTTLLILPGMLSDFLDYNDFLDSADRLLIALDLDGVLQIASFHPHYQFAGSQSDDIENFTNRSPYPMLHLLRESSIDRAVSAFPNADEIVERNLVTLRRLGHAGWDALDLPIAPHRN